MKRPAAIPSLLFLVVLLGAALPALAEDAPPAAPTNPEDYRWAIYTSCTAAFAALIVFLVVSRLRARETAEELAAVERRLDELEKGEAR